ncbi:hypothetical protein Bbelb_310480 [Branchiostoma belcheri]|nr:hypothetical protein Bbelb_310480 [Branchiostoma belcheri]
MSRRRGRRRHRRSRAVTFPRCPPSDTHADQKSGRLRFLKAAAITVLILVAVTSTAGWLECVPHLTEKPATFLIFKGSCVLCEGLGGDVASVSPFPFLATVHAVAIRGYPFHVLSARTLAPLEHSKVDALALIDANITDVENNTFAGFSSLEKLSLDSNRLESVNQTWFTGLENLLVLILSNNSIRRIEPGIFVNLTRLHVLDLENNLLQAIDPSLLFGPNYKVGLILILSSNAISSVSRGSFHCISLAWLDLRDNDLSCLDEDVFRGQSSLLRLHVSSGMLASVHNAMPHKMAWSLHRLVSLTRGSVTVVVQVPKFLFCAWHHAYGLSFGWVFDSSDKVAGKTGAVSPGKCSGNLDTSMSTISLQPPVVVLATDGFLSTDKPDTNTLEQCRQVWEYGGGIAVPLVGNSIFRLVSRATGNTTSEGVGMAFVKKQHTDALTTTESSTHNTHTNTRNITCILLTRGEHTMFFTVPDPVHGHHGQCQTYTTETSYTAGTIKHSSSPTHYTDITETENTSSESGHYDSTLHVMSNTTLGPDLEVVQAPCHIVIPVVVSAVAVLAMSFLAVLLWKVRAARLNTEDDMASKTASDDAASCKSLPAVLYSIEPTYSEIPDDVACAHRPLPGLPHVYSDDAGVVRSASLPACSRGATPDDAASCRSLPAVLQFIEPTYSQIPDHIAAAQRPLPAPPRACWERPGHDTAAQRPLPVPHTYSEIPDGESGPMPFYADAEILLRVITSRQLNRPAFRTHGTHSSSRSPQSMATYGSSGQTKGQRNPFYRSASDVKGIRARRQLRTALVSQPADQGVSHYANATDAILSRGHDVTFAHIALLTLPNTYWPWEIPGEGTHNTPRRASLPTVTLPNTYWPWEIPGEGTRNSARRVSLPTVTLPNTYWPWEIPGEGTCNTPRRVSLPTVTLPNTYWPWEIPGEGTRNSARRVSLPTVTLPNTYWPWEIPGEGTRNSARRVSLPTVTLPNTYWPWEIPGEGTRNTAQRVSLPTVTLPNTYWPWEIPGEGTHNTPRRVSLPTVTLPNTYWPWEIPGEGTRNTAQRVSLPTVTLPNTYWPWEIPGEGTHNTPRRASLPTVTLPNTYWPWEIPGEGTRNTAQRVSLPTVTLPNTYWPWEIPGEGTRNSARRVSLPTVTLPNTYWPWEIPGEGARNTPRETTLHPQPIT